MITKLTAHEQPISRIFSNDYVFKIPPYQRPYAWTKTEAGELFDDLLEFISARSREVEELPPYFLGSIVLIKQDTLPDADVVDGQQRLTTLTMLLSAIRFNVGAQNAADITQLIYEKGSQILGTQDRFRLSLRERDRDFFKKHIQRDDGFERLINSVDVETDSQRHIRDNALLFDAKLKDLSESVRLKIAQFIVTKCYLVTVATPDLDSAYRIFSVLNTRGLDLSATDILKAQIIGGIEKVEREQFTKKWEDTEEDLGRDQFVELFSHIRMVYRKAKPHGTLLEEFKEHVLNHMPPKFFIDEVLIPMAKVYTELKDEVYSSTEKAEQINEYLKWLNRLAFNDWIPPALAFAVRKHNEPAAMDVFFRDLERLTYSLLITKSGINERIERFSKLTKAIEEDEDLYRSSSPLQLTGIEQHDTFSVLSGPIYETLSAQARSTILLKLDALVSSGGATYDYETITVEHILPQNPPADSEWIRWFPDPTIRATVVHQIGNLVLLTRKKNSAASNFNFSYKKIAYFTKGGVSPFALTTQVLQYQIWTPEIVSLRQKDLLALFEKHWRLSERRDPQLEKEAIVAYLGDKTWRDDVYDGLVRLQGRGTLANIYREVGVIRRESGRSIPRSLEAVIRRTLEENSSDSDSYKGGPDIFHMPEGKGAGFWAIKSSANKMPS